MAAPEPMTSGRVRAFGLSHIGEVREENQDTFRLLEAPDEAVRERRGVVAVLADGMGGLKGGRIASELAVAAVAETYYGAPGDVGEALEAAAQEGNRRILRHSIEKAGGQPMGSTLTAIAVLGDSACLVHVGDSRAYRLRAGELTQVTRDHSLLRELQERGAIDPDSPMVSIHRNVLTRALGLGEEVEVDLYEIADLAPGERYLLSSDGFHELASEAEIAAGLAVPAEELEQACERFVELARERGGPDNITVVVVAVGEEPESAPAPDRRSAGSEDVMKGHWRKGSLIPLSILIAFLAGAGGALLVTRDAGRDGAAARRELGAALDALIERVEKGELTAPGAFRRELQALRARLGSR